MSERRAWGWVEHLRAGGTTAWTDWTGEAAASRPALPGAQQLEIVRRLNQTGSPSPTLLERVLDASAPGRGQPDLALVGAGRESRFGPRPVDPARLPDRELLRVCATILAEDVVATGLPAPARAGRPRPWRQHYRLVGDPELADPARAWLVAHGHPPGGRNPTVLVLARDLGRMLADIWVFRAFDKGVLGWRPWLRMLKQRDQLPPRADPLDVARRWDRIVGRGQVHVVLDPAALPELVGTRGPLPGPADPAAEVADLARRVAPAVGLLVPPDLRAELMTRTLRPRLAEAPGAPVVVPPAHRAWLGNHAQRIADGLRRSGYAVHGDPGLLLPGEGAGVEGPRDTATLELAMRMMLAGPSRPLSEEGA